MAPCDRVISEIKKRDRNGIIGCEEKENWRQMWSEGMACVCGKCGCLRSYNSYELPRWMITSKSATYIVCAWVKRWQQAKRINSSTVLVHLTPTSHPSPIRIHNSHSSEKPSIFAKRDKYDVIAAWFVDVCRYYSHCYRCSHSVDCIVLNSFWK